MSQIIRLLVRDLKIFLRDRKAVLFAVLAPAVMCGLFLVIMRDQFPHLVTGAAGPMTQALFDAWVFSSMAVVAGFASGSVVLLGFIEDRSAKRFGLYLASQIKPWLIPLSYLLVSVVTSFVASAAGLGLHQIWARSFDQPVVSMAGWVKMAPGLILVSVFLTAMSAVAATAIRSRTGFGAYCLIGTVLTGVLTFFCLMPHDEILLLVMGLLPFGQAATLVCGPAMAPSLDLLPGTDAISFILGGDRAGLLLILWSAILMAAGLWRMTQITRAK